VLKLLKYLSLALVFLYFFVGGIAHFVATDRFVRIVPPYIPFPLAAVYVSGVFELLGGIGLCLPRWRERAGNGLIALTICVTPANVHMWLNPQLFPTMSEAALFWRLPLQVGLLGLIWWSTRAKPGGGPGGITGDPAPVAGGRDAQDLQRFDKNIDVNPLQCALVFSGLAK